MLVDAAQPGWNVLYANRGWQLLLQLCQNVLAGDSANVQPAQQVASIVGQTLWPAVSQQLQEKAANCAGQSHSDRLLQLVKERKSFTLSGIALANLGGAAVTMSFRCDTAWQQAASGLCLLPYNRTLVAAAGLNLPDKTFLWTLISKSWVASFNGCNMLKIGGQQLLLAVSA